MPAGQSRPPAPTTGETARRPPAVAGLGPRGVAAAELLLRTLAAHGIERLWFCSGSELVPLQEAAVRLRERGVAAPRIAPALHEHLAICAAMGESMVSGLPVAVVAHADLGALNFGAELHTALRGGYPVLLMSGYPATHPERRTSQAFWNQQRWDQGATLRQYTKWDYKLAAHEPLGTVVARAIQVARTAPAGPAYLALPAEVLAAGEVVGEVDTADRLGVPRHGPGDRDGVRQIARRLLAAERPLLITERLGRDEDAVALLAELGEHYAVGVRTTRYRMSLPTEHPAQLAAPTPAEADVVVVLEHAVPWIPATGAPAPDAWIAVVGTDPMAAEIPLYEFPADLRLYADPAAFLEALLGELAAGSDVGTQARLDLRRRDQADLAATAAAARAERRRDAMALPHLTPAGLGACLDEFLDPEDLLVDELGDTEELAGRTLPGTLFQNGGSSLGWAASAAVGAALAAPERLVVCATGDGGYVFGGASTALWAQQRYDAPVLTVVADNRGYRTGTSHVDAYYPDGAASSAGDYTGGVFDPAPDHAVQAVACGAVGLTARTPQELREALRHGRAVVTEQRRSVVIDAVLPDHLGVLPPGPPGDTSDRKADQ